MPNRRSQSVLSSPSASARAEATTPATDTARTVVPWWAEALVVALLIVAPLPLHRPYNDQGHCEDDIDHLKYLGEYLNGERSTGMFLLAPINEHLLPAWRVWYYACWRAFDFDPTGWHITISLTQGFSAAMLYLVLRAYTGQFVPALFAAGLWAIAGIGTWENPLSWIPSSHLAFGVAWIVAAMACLTRYRAPGWIWPALMAFCLTLAVLWMSAMWALAPVLAAQWWLLERRAGESWWWPQTRWAVAWLVPFAATGVLAILAAMQVFEPDLRPQKHDALAAIIRTPASWALSAENLTYRNTGTSPVAPLLGTLPAVPIRAAAGLVSLLVLFVLPGVNRRLILLFVGTVLVYSLLVQYARSSAGELYALTMGRYAYLPTLGWCGVIGALLATPWLTATPLRKWWLYTALLLATPWLVWQQQHTINVAAQQFDRQTRISRGDLRASRELLQTLSRAGEGKPQQLRVPSVTWVSRPVDLNVAHCLKLFACDGLDGIELADYPSWTDADRRALDDALARTSNPMRWTFADSLDYHLQVAQTLHMLDAAAAAAGTEILVPELAMQVSMKMFAGRGEFHPPATSGIDRDWGLISAPVKLTTLAQRMFPQGLAHCRIVDSGEMSGAQWDALLAALAQVPTHAAREWEPFFRPLAEKAHQREAKRAAR